MARVVVLDPISKDGLAVLERAEGIEYQVCTGLQGPQLRETLMEFDGAICRSGVKITAEVLEGNRRLRAIARAGVGTDNIDKETATRLGIVVMNTPGGNTISTAEHTLALMLALSRNIYPAYQSLIEGRWDRRAYMGKQLAGKTLGVIGMGRIGQAVAVRAMGFGMKVLAYDPFLSAQRAKALGVKTCESTRELLSQVDYVTIHTPLTDSTRKLIGPREIRLMKPGARIINCARGGIVDEEALVEGLRTGHLGGVALDVFETEPCTKSPLFGMPGVLCTPHLGASTFEAQSLVAMEAAQLLVDFFTTGAIKQSVNMSPLDPATLADLRGFLNLAWRLGLLMAQVDHAPPTMCRLRYRGEVANKQTGLLSAAFAAGLMEHAMEEEVNIVNAAVLLRDRGIELVEERSSDIGDFSSMITAEVVSEHRTAVASGTLFGNSIPQLVQKANCRLESYLDGILMIFLHRDVPGVIGRVGSIFGQYQVNIASMSVGRPTHKPGGEAIGVLSLDSEPPPEALEAVNAMDTVERAWIVHLPGPDELPVWMGAGR